MLASFYAFVFAFAASVRFRSGVYFHHGLAGFPPMNRTAAMVPSHFSGDVLG
jgi:hypothetical protein